MFFKCDLKIVSNQETENITLSVLNKRLTWCFQNLNYLQFFNHIWKTSQGIAFSTYKIVAYVPPSAIQADQLRTFDETFFVSLILAYRQENYIYLVKKILIIDLLIFGMDFFQYSGHNMMPISCNAS